MRLALHALKDVIQRPYRCIGLHLVYAVQVEVLAQEDGAVPQMQGSDGFVYDFCVLLVDGDDAVTGTVIAPAG